MQIDQSNLIDAGLLTVPQAAERIGVSEQCVRNWISAGGVVPLVVVTTGKSRRVFIKAESADGIARCREEYGNHWMAVVRVLAKQAQIAIDEGRV